MKLPAVQVFFEKLRTKQTRKKVLLLASTLILVTLIELYFNGGFGSLMSQRHEFRSDSFRSEKPEKECDIFRGKWVENPKWSYYNNRTCDFQIDYHNCKKYGRTDEEFLKWRWKPDKCELPFFDGAEFVEVLRGKSLAFVGDSIARNHMQSLLCFLSSVASSEEIYKQKPSSFKFRSWFYADYNVTISIFWSPHLVKSDFLDPANLSTNSLMNIYLDQEDGLWMNEMESLDYVIISAGAWFFRRLMLYENGRLVGCAFCDETNVTRIEPWYGYRKAFRTVFNGLNRLENFKGEIFLRTFSPSHYENGEWKSGGSCGRKLPLAIAEIQPFPLQMLMIQMEEFAVAEKKGLERGLKFRVLNVTEAMAMRPDGHPNHYVLKKNSTIADCTHWCLPGPIDLWNELLLYMLKT